MLMKLNVHFQDISPSPSPSPSLSYVTPLTVENFELLAPKLKEEEIEASCSSSLEASSSGSVGKPGVGVEEQSAETSSS